MRRYNATAEILYAMIDRVDVSKILLEMRSAFFVCVFERYCFVGRVLRRLEFATIVAELVLCVKSV